MRFASALLLLLILPSIIHGIVFFNNLTSTVQNLTLPSDIRVPVNGTCYGLYRTVQVENITVEFLRLETCTNGTVTLLVSTTYYRYMTNNTSTNWTLLFPLIDRSVDQIAEYFIVKSMVGDQVVFKVYKRIPIDDSAYKLELVGTIGLASI